MTLFPKQQFRELLALTEIYLTRNYPKGVWKIADGECFEFFKKQAKKEPKPSILSKPVERNIQTTNSPPPSKPTKAPPISGQPEIKSKGWTFETRPLEKVATQDLSEMERLIKNELPELQLKEKAPPQVSPPSQKKTSTPFVVISCESLPILEQLFLKNLARALNRCVAPTTLLQEKQLTDQFLDELSIKKALVLNNSKYKGNPKAFVLDPLTTYLQDPYAKRALWETLQELKKPSNSSLEG